MGGTSSTTQPSSGNGFSQALGAGLSLAGLFFNKGGSVENGYAPGGITQNTEFGIPDMSMSFIPSAVSGNPVSSSIPPAPVVHSEDKDAGMSSIDAGLGSLKGALK